MKSAWLIFATVCAASCSVVVGLDLGPMIWAAQCQSECLRHFTNYQLIMPSVLQDFKECAEYCKMCHDGENTEVCWQDDVLKRAPKRFRKKRSVPAGRTIACNYCKTRELTSYEPSMLPAPENRPITMGPHDVAIVFQRQYKRKWDFQDYYYGRTLIGMEYPCHWIIVVTENGPKQYTWQRWVPNLESLKEGPLVEASISWRNASQQLEFQQKLEETRITHDHRRHLQLSSEKVLMMTIDNKLQRTLIQQLFWKSDASERKLSRNKYWDKFSETCRYYLDDEDDDDDGNDSSNKSLVVTWGPEAGGLTGNQVTDGDSAQISLLPGVKYQVRVASNNGPGSFPIVIDTRHVANHTPPSPPSPSSSVCKESCCAKLFAFAGWQYVLVLLLVVILLFCYIWVDSWLMRKSDQMWEKA